MHDERGHFYALKRGMGAAALMVMLLAGGREARGDDGPSLEQQVKSGFVVNFVQFVDWPASAFAKADDPIVIGVVDGGGVGDALAKAMEGKTVRGHKLVVQAMTAANIGKCHVLLVGDMEGEALQNAIKAAGQTGVLTIGDSAHMTEGGGVIQFYLEDRKVRFEINTAAAGREQLQISSKLLKLARVVNK